MERPECFQEPVMTIFRGHLSHSWEDLSHTLSGHLDHPESPYHHPISTVHVIVGVGRRVATNRDSIRLTRDNIWRRVRRSRQLH
jgi:hypothetical protein